MNTRGAMAPEDDGILAQLRSSHDDPNKTVPAAWSYLAKIQFSKTINHNTETIIEAVKYLCKHEKRLQIKKFDLDKLIINVAHKLPIQEVSCLIDVLMPRSKRYTDAALLANHELLRFRSGGELDTVKFFRAISKLDHEKALAFLSRLKIDDSIVPSNVLSTVWVLPKELLLSRPCLKLFEGNQSTSFLEELVKNLDESLLLDLFWSVLPVNRSVLKYIKEDQHVAGVIIGVYSGEPNITSLKNSSRVQLSMESLLEFGWPALVDIKSLAFLVKLLKSESLSINYARKFYDLDQIEACWSCFGPQIRSEQTIKMARYIGSQLVKSGRTGEALPFLEYAGEFECLASICLKLGKFNECRYALSKLIAQNMAKRSEMIHRFCSLPVTAPIDWNRIDPQALDLILPYAIEKAHKDLIEAAKDETTNESVVYWKHKYYLSHHKDAPLGQLIEECERFGGRFEEYKPVWKFLIGELNIFEDIKIETGPTDCVLGELRLAHQQLRSLQQDLQRSKSKDIRELSRITYHIIQGLRRLSQLYRRMGVWKPTRSYLKQAYDLAHGLWPKNELMWKPLLVQLRNLDLAALGSSEIILDDDQLMVDSIHVESKAKKPFWYVRKDSDDTAKELDALERARKTFHYGSPHLFKMAVMDIIDERCLDQFMACCLLSVASWLPFFRRDQVDRINEDIDDLVFSSSDQWIAFISSPPFTGLSSIGFYYNERRDILLAVDHGTSSILSVPLTGLTMNQATDMIIRLQEENKRILFCNDNHGEADQAEFKRAWWNKRKALDVQVADLAAQIETHWLPLVKGFLFKKPKWNFDKGRLSSITGVDCIPDGLVNFLTSFGPQPKARHLDMLTDLLEGSLGFDMSADRCKFKAALRSCYEDIERNVFLKVDPPEQIEQIPLILDKQFHPFPWEVTPTLAPIRVYRHPSVWHFAKAQELVSRTSSSISYILNPGGDLKRTEQFFTPKLATRHGWHGIVGRPPQEQEFIDSLVQSDLFLYFGHGGGDSYVSGSKIRKSSDLLAPSFLIGCSSGRLKALGEFCPEGTLLNYLYAGCPSILVNLWDVTDKDIDKFTDELFSLMGLWDDQPQGENLDLASAIQRSRTACLLKYINGAAPIAYGLPFQWSNDGCK